jgi:hypothetical protein
MRVDCRNLQKALRQQEPELLEAFAAHAAACPACREQLRQWDAVSEAARGLRKSWDSPQLWPRIHQALLNEAARDTRPRILVHIGSWNWRAAVAAASVLAITLSAAWILWRNYAPEDVTRMPPGPRRLLTEQALRDVESAEAAYIQSIEKLSKLVEPKLGQPASALTISYREKLMLIDSAIAELRAGIERNRFNAHLRQELLAIYQQKQRTLQEMMREDRHASQ